MLADQFPLAPVADLVNGKRKVSVIRILNPFNPKDHVREELYWTKKKTLLHYFPMGTVEQVVSVNGKIIPAADFATTTLQRGDSVVTCPIPEGGGGSKNLLAIVAMIAVAVFAPQLAIGLNGLLGTGFAAGSLGMSMLTAGVSFAGSLLVHTIFAPSKPSASEATSTSATYGIDGAKNSSVEGIPVPICYGSFRMAGNIISLHVDNDGDTQILYMLINAGEGQVSSIGNIEIDGNPLAEFKNVETQIRLGLANQSVIPWFTDTVIPISLSHKLTQTFYYHSTVNRIDKLRVDVVCPGGLFKLNSSSGKYEEQSVDLDIQYRLKTDSTWTPMVVDNVMVGKRPITCSKSYPTPGGHFDESGNYYVPDITTNLGDQNPTSHIEEPILSCIYDDTRQPLSAQDQEYANANVRGVLGTTSVQASIPIYGTVARVTAATRSSVRRSFTSPKLVSGEYEVRVRRATPKSTDDKVADDVYVSDVNEIILQELTYPNTALLGLKIKLGDQITGVPSVTYMNGGKQISAYGRPTSASANDQWFETASSNPAWIMWDVLTSKRYGGGISTARLDFPAFRRWAKYCEDNTLEWHGPIDTEMNVWDASQYILRCGHAQLVNVGTRWSVVVESEAAPVMMFSVANMIENTYKETWLPMTDRATEVDVTFFDQQENYKQRTIKVYDPAVLSSGRKQRSSAVTLYGVVDSQRAFREGVFMMNLNRFILKTISFSAPLEAVACSVGDVILVQHDMPNWAQAGRFEAGSTRNQLKLDRPVTMEAGKSYKVLIHHDTKLFFSGNITSISGGMVFLPGLSGAKPGMRLRTATGDTRISEGYSGSVEVDSLNGISAGQPCEVFITDFIEEFVVPTYVGQFTTIGINGPASQAPAQFGQWMFGETTRVKAPFRIKSVHGSSEYKRDIDAVQYDARIYDYTRFPEAPTKPPGRPQDGPIGQVRNLTAFEETFIAGTDISTNVTASWTIPATGMYLGADIYYSRVKKDNGKYPTPALTLFGSVNNKTAVKIPATREERVTVKVVAFDLQNKKAPFDSAPQVIYDVVAQPDLKPPPVTGADVIWNGRDCRLTWRYNSATNHYDFGSEPVGADSGSLDPTFQDYEIRVFKASDPLTAKPRRVDHVTANSYTYTFDNNYTDGITRRLRFEIRVRDKLNNLGAPTSLTAFNPPPVVTGVSMRANFEGGVLSYTHSKDPDFAGAVVWMAQDEKLIPAQVVNGSFDKFKIFEGPDSSITINRLQPRADYYVRVACYDLFGQTEIVASDVIHFKTTVLDASAIGDGILDGSILGPALLATIDLVNNYLPGSVNARITQEATARAQAIIAAVSGLRTVIDAETLARVNAILDEATKRDAAITVERTARQTKELSVAGDLTLITTHIGENAAAIAQERTARTTKEDATATLISSLGARVGANEAGIVSEQQVRATKDSAMASDIQSLFAKTDSNTALITTETQVRTSKDDALAVRIDTLSTTVGSNTARITTEETARATADSAISTRIDTLSATTGSNTAAIQTETTARVNADGALGQRIDVVTAANASNLALITSETTARTSADGALATRVDGVVALAGVKNRTFSQSTAPTTGMVEGDLWFNTAEGRKPYRFTNGSWQPTDDTRIAEVTASVTSEITARANADGALGQRIDSVRSDYGGRLAFIDTQISALANADGSLSQRIDTVSSTSNGNTATIQTQQTSINGLQAQYTVKVDVNGHVSGFGLATTQNNGAPVSEFQINADRFSIFLPYAGPGATPVHPFVVGVVNGIPRVVITDAIIGDALIKTAHIGLAQITTLKIGDHQVTIPAFGSSGFNQHPVCYVYLEEPGTVYVMATVNWYGDGPHGGSIADGAIDMQINCSNGGAGGYAKINAADGYSYSIATSWGFDLGAGGWLFQTSSQNPGTHYPVSGTIMALGAKR